MNRREFITFFGGAAASAWPFAARAQAPDRVRRIGVLSGLAEEDPESRLRAGTFERALRDLGWIKGRNLHIEYRSAGDGALLRKYSDEMVQLAPELIVANSTPVTA